MERPKKKHPSEYPLFAVRLTSEQKNKLAKAIDSTRKTLNSKVKKDIEHLWMKNDVVYEALMLGLPLLKKQGNTED